MIKTIDIQDRMEQMIDEILQKSAPRGRLKTAFLNLKEKRKIPTMQELDQYVFCCMYGRESVGSEISKIRFWRTGRHSPVNGCELDKLMNVLQVSEKDREEIIQEFTVDMAYHTLSDEQVEYLRALYHSYLVLIPQERLHILQIRPGEQYEQARHIFYVDVLEYLALSKEQMSQIIWNHEYSRTFSSEWNRFFRNGTSLSRSTMIRLLLVLSMPEINVDILNEQLSYLGYAPLSQDLRTRNGVCVDSMLLFLLEVWEQNRTGEPYQDTEQCKALFQQMDKTLLRRIHQLPPEHGRDAIYHQRQKLMDLRMMKFRSFGKEIEI